MKLKYTEAKVLDCCWYCECRINLVVWAGLPFARPHFGKLDASQYTAASAIDQQQILGETRLTRLAQAPPHLNQSVTPADRRAALQVFKLFVFCFTALGSWGKHTNVSTFVSNCPSFLGCYIIPWYSKLYFHSRKYCLKVS